MQQESIVPLLEATHSAAPGIRLLSNEKRIALTHAIADMVEANTGKILAANQKDLALMQVENPLYDRVLLNENRLKQIAAATHQVADLPDPSSKKLSSCTKDNGLLIEKYTVPLGVVGAIYEARPNVTIDISALCMRSGNAVLLKGGSDAAFTNAILVELLQKVITDNGLDPSIITLLPNDRAGVATLLTATRFVDVIIPRGSQSLINFVRANATVPTIETGAGVCHTYVHASANLEKAAAIVVNAKTQRPSVCNALDTVLVDAGVAEKFLPMLIDPFKPFGVGIFADDVAFAILEKAGYKQLHHAATEDFGREYLSQQCSIKVVSGIEEALMHIDQYSSKHSEAIVCEDTEIAQQFLQIVDAAAVYHNASTRFTDGGEFGLGAELGISTQKLHARGPFALDKLVCEKWVIQGNGQIR